MTPLPFASGSAHTLIYCPEEVYGLTPPSPALRRLRHTACDLMMRKDSLLSRELREDAQVHDLRHGNRNSTGRVDFEFSYGAFDDMLAAALRNTWEGPLLKAGVARPSFTLQRIFTDVGQHETFTGCCVNGLSLRLGVNALCTGSLTFVGRDAAFDAGLWEAAAAPEQAPYDGFSGSLSEGGVRIATITAVELNVANGIEPAYVIGDAATAGLSFGHISVTGTVSAFFQNMDLLRKFVHEEESALECVLGDAQSPGYRITLPRLKYTGGNHPAESDGPIVLSLPFQALREMSSGTSLSIERQGEENHARP